MNKKLYIHEIQQFSDFKIYKKSKQYLNEEQAGFSHNSKKLDLLYEESKSRDISIFNESLEDSIKEFNKVTMPDIYGEISSPKKFASNDNSEISKSTVLFDHNEIDKEKVFLCSVHGDSMIDAKIDDGDTLIVEQTEFAKDNNIIIAIVNQKMFVKRYRVNKQGSWLVSENPALPDVKITEQIQFSVFGRVWACIKRM